MAEGKWVSYLRVSTGRQGRSGSGLEAHRAAVAHRRAKGVPSPRAVGMPRSLSPAATSLRGAGGDRGWGRIDVLHYNVGVSIAGGDAPLDEITEDAFDRIAAVNLRGAIMACKHVLPLMRAQRAGVIITVSSVAAWERYPNVAYKATKAGMIAFTQQVAIQNAEFGVRAM